MSHRHHNMSHLQHNMSHWQHNRSQWHHNRSQWHGRRQYGQIYDSAFSGQTSAQIQNGLAEPPAWNQIAARARWLVYHSTWASVGTISIQLEGAPWGSMRSVADGVGRNSIGVPVLYIPSPDPLA